MRPQPEDVWAHSPPGRKGSLPLATPSAAAAATAHLNCGWLTPSCAASSKRTLAFGGWNDKRSVKCLNNHFFRLPGIDDMLALYYIRYVGFNKALSKLFSPVPFHDFSPQCGCDEAHSQTRGSRPGPASSVLGQCFPPPCTQPSATRTRWPRGPGGLAHSPVLALLPERWHASLSRRPGLSPELDSERLPQTHA